jgi:hypothetical protein
MILLTLKYLDRKDAFFPGYYLANSNEYPIFHHLTNGLFSQWIGSVEQVAQLERVAAMHNVTIIKIPPTAS